MICPRQGCSVTAIAVMGVLFFLVVVPEADAAAGEHVAFVTYAIGLILVNM